MIKTNLKKLEQKIDTKCFAKIINENFNEFSDIKSIYLSKQIIYNDIRINLIAGNNNNHLIEIPSSLYL